ncbi:MAG: peroxiredoxin [Sandaracinus sp.]
MATAKKKPAPKPAAAAKKPAAAKPAKVLPTPKIGALAEGDTAPDFSLEGDDGQKHSLSALRGKSVVVYFYPKDDTPGCTLEARDFAAASKTLAKKNAVVFGVSRDSIASHCKFKEKYGLGFTLLSDPGADVIARWGAWGEKNMYGNKSMGIVRTTVVVGPDGKVKKVFPKVKVAGHVDAVIAAI